MAVGVEDFEGEVCPGELCGRKGLLLGVSLNWGLGVGVESCE